MDDREAANRAAQEHIERLRRQLADGKSEIDRQRASVDETREHMSGMSRWIEQTEQSLGEERARRSTPSDD